jgi:hypothetical protein
MKSYGIIHIPLDIRDYVSNNRVYVNYISDINLGLIELDLFADNTMKEKKSTT